MDWHPKSQLHQQFFDEYRDLDLDGRRLWLLHAVDEVERLPPAHRTFDELKAERAARLLPVRTRASARCGNAQ